MLMQKDYEALTGRWQLVKSIVDGKPVPEDRSDCRFVGRMLALYKA